MTGQNTLDQSKKAKERKKKRTWGYIVGGLVAIVLVSIVVAVFARGSVAPQKVYRVGILVGVDAYTVVADGFVAQMTELGYVEGENVSYEIHNVSSDETKMSEICEQFVADEVDLIFAITHGAALAAKAATEGTDIPVVFDIAATEGDGLVESVREPGGNITGVRWPGPEAAGKRLEFLLEMAPQTERIWVPYLADYPAALGDLQTLRPMASSEEVTLVEVPATSLEEIEADIQTRTGSGLDVDAVMLLSEPLAHSDAGWTVIADFAAEHKLPIAGTVTAFVYEGGKGAIFSYAPNAYEMGEQAAPLADKIFKGTQAGTIPVVTPELYLKLNYKLAQELGLTVDEGLLSLAAEILR